MRGSVVLVTGGSSGIGRACAERFAALDATVVLTSRRASNTITELDGAAARPVLRHLDVRDEASVLRLFGWIDGQYGHLDVLVNNAGIGVFGPVETLTATLWADVIATNLTGAFLCAREAFRRMKAQGGGRIINIGSVADHRAMVSNAAYSASKFGLRGLSLVMAEEGAAVGVRVSLVSPGAVRTDMWRGRNGFDPADMLDPDEVASVVVDIAQRPLGVRIDEVRLAPPKGVL